MIERAFPNHRQAALALLNSNQRFSYEAGRFLGQLTVDPSPLTEKQFDWLAKLLKRADLPPMASGEGR